MFPLHTLASKHSHESMPGFVMRQKPLRMVLVFVSLLGLTGCEQKRSSDFATSQLRASITIRADYQTGVAVVAGSVSVFSGDYESDSVRLVDGDRLVASWGNVRRTLYRRQSELDYRARLPVGQSNTVRIALLRQSPRRRDAPDSIVTLPDIESFRVDEALQTLNSQSTLTLRWIDDPVIASNIAPEVTATALSCVDIFGESANDTLSKIPASRLILRDAAGSAQINLAELIPVNMNDSDIAQCEWGIRLSLSSDAVQTDSALPALDASATVVSVPVIVTMDYTTAGVGS